VRVHFAGLEDVTEFLAGIGGGDGSRPFRVEPGQTVADLRLDHRRGGREELLEGRVVRARRASVVPALPTLAYGTG
jgi:hypothetical protein